MDTQGTQDFDNQGIQEFRIERGAQVVGTDGALGTVEQIVVDRETGEVQSLVVRGEAGMDFDLPADRIESASGDHVYLSIGRADLAAHPELAPPHRAELFVPVDEGIVVPPSEVRNLDVESPVIMEIELDAVELAAAAPSETVLDILQAGADVPDIADQPTIVLGPDTMPATAPMQAEPSVGEDVAPSGPAATSAEEPEPDRARAEPVPPAGAVPPMATPNVTDATIPVAPGPAAVEAEPGPQIQTRVVPVMSPPVAATGPFAEPSMQSRGPQGADYREPGLGARLAPLTATIILVGAAGAGVAYLVLRRRQRLLSARPSNIRAARARLRDLRSATSAVAQGALARMPSMPTPTMDGLLDVDRLRQMRPGPTTGALLRAAWEAASQRASNLRSPVRLNAALDAIASGRQAAQQSLRAAGGLVAGMTYAARDSALRAQTQGMRLAEASSDAAGALWRSVVASFPRLLIRVRRPMMMRSRTGSRAAAAPAAGAERAATTSVREAQRRRAAPRRAARIGRRLRWFRRGLIAGSAWSILFAPEAGQAARQRLAARFGGTTSAVPQAMTSSTSDEHVGATGPHPLTPSGTTRAPFTGVESSAPLVQPTSEEPVLPSPPPDIFSDDLPATPPAP